MEITSRTSSAQYVQVGVDSNLANSHGDKVNQQISFDLVSLCDCINYSWTRHLLKPAPDCPTANSNQTFAGQVVWFKMKPTHTEDDPVPDSLSPDQLPSTPIEKDNGESEEEEPAITPSNCLTRTIDQLDHAITSYCRHHRKYIRYATYGVLLVIYVIYFSFAMLKDFHRALALLIFTVFAVLYVTWGLIDKYWGEVICTRFWEPCSRFIKRNRRLLSWLVYILLLAALIAFAGYVGIFKSITSNPQQLISGVGIVVFILALPAIIFFSYIMEMLFYTGLMHWITGKFAWAMQYTMDASGAEAMTAAANVFMGMTAAPLVVKPYLNDMTSSEIHAVLTSGYATIAGNILGVYAAFGISISHLLSASVMSAPAALAVSKIFYPELGRPKTKHQTNMYTPKRTEKNILEAAANGATDGMNICASIITQLIAILSTLAFLNAVLSWLGSMVDHPELNFQFLCRYVLYPVAWLMGVDPQDCYIVAELVGVKTFLNEFVAYKQLGGYITNRNTGIGPTISVRSEVIATYALCGFSNIGGVAIFIGAFGSLVPSKKTEITVLSVRALIAGSVTCFMTACVAGVLYDEEAPRYFESGMPVESIINSTLYGVVNATNYTNYT
uniref:Solute carrier family 28 member 3-like n=1 Tax=Saccoglossus kowalevskii TaxID=10224 RepID=A0ABM0MHF2_SACKO|nr:PREDICTED: solute carrier family 28 member 3-like [Saccoglossus kowalevskii]